MTENAEGTLPSAFYAGHQFPNAHCVCKARHTHHEQEEEGKMPSSSCLSGPRAVVRSPPSSDGDLRPYLKKLRVLHKECYNDILQLTSSLCNTVQNVRQSGL